jgi:8-oxo-dGTP diphosphatase
MAGSVRRKFTYDYPRPALTVDVALVSREARPRVLLIQRAGEPFKDCWALPGGFAEPNERLIDAASRELKEETGVDFTDLEQLYTAGDPGRDPRGWTVSVAFLARTEPDRLNALAGDDAKAVKWFPLDRLPKLAFDHAMILGRVRARLADRIG